LEQVNIGTLVKQKKSIEASGCEILTVAVRRAQTAQVDGIAQLLNGFDWSKLWLLPNTAGCQTAEEAIRLAFIGREIAKKIYSIMRITL